MKFFTFLFHNTAQSYLALLRATMLHYGFQGRKATAGNLAFPFSPSDLTVLNNGVTKNITEKEKEKEVEYVTVCGTRDPAFITQHDEILAEVQSYVASMVDKENDGNSEILVQCIPCGLQGQPKLRVTEHVIQPTGATTETKILNMFDEFNTGTKNDNISSKKKQKKTVWQCDGGSAADFTVHHLITMDDAIFSELFKVQVHQADGSVRNVIPTLREWGATEYGDQKSNTEAVQHWQNSSKPLGSKETKVDKTLGSLAEVIRSKNAGVNEITFDCIFTDLSYYEAAKQSPALDPVPVGDLLKRPVLGVFCDDASLAIKITCDREVNAGSQGDRDVYGAQQHRLLVDLVL